MTSEKRLNKFISESGFCSRREADKLIEQQRVTINGQLPELGTKVQPGDCVEVDGKPIKASAANKSDRIYIAYNKPIGITCTTERDVKGNIIDAIGHKRRIFPIGRLDKPSEGLIFLTSDGDIVNKILRAENAHDKEYEVTVDQPVSERFLSKMASGVPILGTVTQPCRVSLVSKYQFRIILTQGLNRQIRRMCEYLGYDVKALKRIRIMNVDLTGLKSGQWRNLTEQEMAEINAAVAGSSKTATDTAQPKQNGTFKLARPIKPRSGNPRRPSGQGEGRGALERPNERGEPKRKPREDNHGRYDRSERSDSPRLRRKPESEAPKKKKVFVDNPNKPKAEPKPKPVSGNTLTLKRKPK
ncbi:23S rRNA pseudouridine(2604) synthase RluF [Ferrimonas aestuarii]|uniref:23S rRNA pseudouridine(2604) synthase RluF n=1 Tax=Ferrimonas aestuarii TaxID=2569539 RepID=UPI001E56AC2F|nr:23S rRNA pseudouridine(2604) synthase RluF [Ferrimonas aestuarii]